MSIYNISIAILIRLPTRKPEGWHNPPPLASVAASYCFAYCLHPMWKNSDLPVFVCGNLFRASQQKFSSSPPHLGITSMPALGSCPSLPGGPRAKQRISASPPSPLPPCLPLTQLRKCFPEFSNAPSQYLRLWLFPNNLCTGTCIFRREQNVGRDLCFLIRLWILCWSLLEILSSVSRIQNITSACVSINHILTFLVLLWLRGHPVYFWPK